MTEFASLASHTGNDTMLTTRAVGYWVTLVLATLALTRLAPTARAADREQAAAIAGELLKHVGVNRGLCVVIGQDPDVVMELVHASELLVLVREPNTETRVRLQRAANEAGVGIDRLVIQQGSPERVPCADRMIDAVIASPGSVGNAEALRALRPVVAAPVAPVSAVAPVAASAAPPGALRISCH